MQYRSARNFFSSVQIIELMNVYSIYKYQISPCRVRGSLPGIMVTSATSSTVTVLPSSNYSTDDNTIDPEIFVLGIFRMINFHVEKSSLDRPLN